MPQTRGKEETMKTRIAFVTFALAAALGLPAAAMAQSGSGAGGDAFSTCGSREAASDIWKATYAATAFDVQVDGTNVTADFIQFSVLLTSVKTKGAEQPIVPSNFVGTLVGFCEVPGVVDLDPPLCEKDADCVAPAACVDQPIPLPGNATYVSSALGKIEDDLAAAVCSGPCDPGETLCVKSIGNGATDSSDKSVPTVTTRRGRSVRVERGAFRERPRRR